MNELKHVDDFLEQYGDRPASELDYLQHWKYIKRERKKGKWVYTYPDDKTGGKTSGVKDVAKNVVDKVKDKLGYDEKAKMEEAKKSLFETTSERVSMEKTAKFAREQTNKENKEQRSDWQDTANRWATDARKKNAGAAKDYANAKDAYSKTTLAKIENAINKGKQVIDKVADTIEDGKEKLSEEKKRRAQEKAEAKQNSELKPRIAELQKQLENFARNGNPIPELNLKTEASTFDEDMSIINPEYSRDPESLYNENCSYCTIAYDLRRRGYDVEAGSEIDANDDGYGDGMTPMTIAECYDGVTVDDFVSIDELAEKYGADYTLYEMAAATEKDMLSQGEGARGNLCVYWRQGGGHSVSWEVENGKVVIRDCQINRKMDLMEYAQLSKSWTYIRTDNLAPNKNVLQYVRNREG